MGAYRVYCLDGVKRIAKAEWMEADSDEKALEIVRARQLPVNCEVWDRKRLVGVVAPHVEQP